MPNTMLASVIITVLFLVLAMTVCFPKSYTYRPLQWYDYLILLIFVGAGITTCIEAFIYFYTTFPIGG